MSDTDQGTTQKEKGLLALLALCAKVLPVAWVTALGSTATAGALVAAAGIVTIGVPSALIVNKAVSSYKEAASMAGKSSQEEAGAGMFGDVRGAFDVSNPELAMRSRGLEEEDSHPDEETTLGLLIPEDYPTGAEGSDEEGGERGSGAGKDSALADAKDALAKTKKGSKLSSLKDRGKGSALSGLGGMGGAGGGGSGGFSSGSGSQMRAGRSSMGSSAGKGLSSASGKTGRGRKAGVRTKGRFKSRSGGAYDNLKGAAKLSDRGYGTSDQTAKGVSQASFGQVPMGAGVVAGGPSAEVSGTPEGDPGMDTVDSDLGDPGSDIRPNNINNNNTTDEPEEDENPLQDLMINALGLLLGALAAVVVAALIPAPDGLLSGPVGWAKLALALAGIGLAIAAIAGPIAEIFRDDSLGMQGMMMGAMLAGMAGYVCYLGVKAMFYDPTAAGEGAGYIAKIKDFLGMGGSAATGPASLASGGDKSGASSGGTSGAPTGPPGDGWQNLLDNNGSNTYVRENPNGTTDVWRQGDSSITTHPPGYTGDI
ncbi:hypothetical protein ACFL6Y_11005 [Elusimicrobiota bacterium]